MKRNLSAFVVALCLAAIAPAQVNFAFNYTDSGTGFNDATLGADRRNALQSAANMLGSYFTGYSSRTVTFDVTSHSTNNGTLASAGSDTVFFGNGFWRTEAQNKIISNVGTNSETLGTINWNFFHNWDYDDNVAGGSYDFKSVAMHEILHGLGFFSWVRVTETGALNNLSGTADVWSIFDQFLTNSSGTRLVTAGAAFNTGIGGIVTNSGGAASDVFFNGANAVAAYGGLVPIYSPATFEAGSSLSHLNTDILGTNNFIMTHAVTTGASVRTLSAVELGILADLGYSVAAIPEPAAYAVLFGVLALLLAARRRAALTQTCHH